MMAEPKPTASLSGILLARKGAARPAMRRPSMLGNDGAAGLSQDDLGWNDMGYDVNPDPTTPMDYEHDTGGFNPLAGAVPDVKPEVREQQERIARQLQIDQDEVDDFEPQTEAELIPMPLAPRAQVAVSHAKRAPKVRAAPGMKEKAAFTLRLDQERHLKLRLACAVSNRSAQMLVTDALDAFLDGMPEIGQLASHVPGRQK